MSLRVACPRCTAKQVYRNTYVCNLCLLTLVVSFMADLYPGAPSHNAPLSAALLWASCNVDVVRSLRRRSFAYVLSVLVLMSLFMDVDFLLSDLKVRQMKNIYGVQPYSSRSIARFVISRDGHAVLQCSAVFDGVSLACAASMMGCIGQEANAPWNLRLERRYADFIPA